MIKQLLEKEFKNLLELETELKNIFKFPEATEEEKRIWPYKTKLYTSPDFLIGKEIYVENKCVGKIKNFILKGTSKYIMISENGKEYFFTSSKVKIFNNFYNEEQIISLHPARDGIKFWSLGYLITEADYKILYYKTNEYRKKLHSFYENKYGEGTIHQSQVPEIKEKITNSIKEKYGVNWFLCRGDHYKEIENIMLKKYGSINFLFSDKWYRAEKKCTVSNLEIKIVKELIQTIDFVQPHYYSTGTTQAIFNDDENRKSYSLDFYDSSLNIAIEIYGDYWHCNPELYNEDFFNKNKQKTAKEIWEFDKKRRQKIINLTNAKFYVIWEKDWNKNKENVKKFLLNEVNITKNEIEQSKKNRES
jgi:hypothetical protein